MTLEHVAIWTSQLEVLKDFYTRFFNGVPNQKYINPQKKFESYFLHFASGARLELMSRPDIPENLNDTIGEQYKGIIHLAFGVDTMVEVDKKASEMKAAGFPILSGSRKTGDGYYEFETIDPDKNRIEVTTLFKE
jgi:lactoylglutathione lyase